MFKDLYLLKQECEQQRLPAYASKKADAYSACKRIAELANPNIEVTESALRSLSENKKFYIEEAYPNQIYNAQYEGQSLIIRVDQDLIAQKHKLENGHFGIKGVDLRQKIALDMFNNPNLSLVTCFGKSGVGKTHLALGTALNMLRQKMISTVYITKPMVSVSNSKFWGTLPGGVEEKMSPFLDSFYDLADSLNMLDEFTSFISTGEVEFLPIAFLRGRNLNHAVIISDECQNMNRHELITLCTRIDRNARLFLLGDLNPMQNDSGEIPGAFRLLQDKRYWESPHTGCINLLKRMRNPIAGLVEDILE